MDISEKLIQIANKEAENIELNQELEKILYGLDTENENPSNVIKEKKRGNHIKTKGLNIVNYRIYGNIESDSFATPDNPTEIKCVGDLVTDAEDPNYGKYKIAYTVNNQEYNLYLTEPLRGSIGYGYGHSGYTGTDVEEYFDYIDFKTQTVVRYIKEIDFTPSQWSDFHTTLYKHNNKYFLRSMNSGTEVKDLITLHPAGGSFLRSAILSTHAQRYFKSKEAKELYFNDCIVGANTYYNLYYYFLIDNYNLELEAATSTDYLVKTQVSPYEYYKIKDLDGNYLTLSEISTLIKNKIKDLNVKIYCPLAEPVIESIEIEPINKNNNNGNIEIEVNTKTEPYYIEVEYKTYIKNFAKKEQEKEFFKDLQQEGKRKDYQYAFMYWKNKWFNPIYPINIKNLVHSVFRYSEIEEINTDVYLMYDGGSYTFANTPNLKTIKNLIIDSGVGFSYTFTNAPNLENINITGIIGKTISFSESSKLTKASITSIVKALAFWQGATLTLSKTAIDNAFETADGVGDGSNSEEWINLISSKSNQYDGLWTISLV